MKTFPQTFAQTFFQNRTGEKYHMPTMRDVAEKAGVSLTTVSHVINRTRFVSDDVTGRVQSAMEELNYRPNELARSLRRGQTNTLGLILPDSANPYFAEIGHAIEATSSSLGYNVILCNTHGAEDREEHYINVLRNKQVDGILFVATGDQANSISETLGENFPILLVDRELVGVRTDVITVDNHRGGLLATRHLLELGHRRIACISGPSRLRPSAERIHGYTQALEEAGLSFDPELLRTGDFHPNSGYQAALELLRLDDPPTAIFTCNDLMAIGVIRAASEQGRPVPDDLALVAFDDIELASYTIPPLTTISQPIDAMGETAARMLIERIEHDGLHTPSRLQLPVELVVRGSSGGPR
jgi:LacI family transcriptional regulator